MHLRKNMQKVMGMRNKMEYKEILILNVQKVCKNETILITIKKKLKCNYYQI